MRTRKVAYPTPSFVCDGHMDKQGAVWNYLPCIGTQSNMSVTWKDSTSLFKMQYNTEAKSTKILF